MVDGGRWTVNGGRLEVDNENGVSGGGQNVLGIRWHYGGEHPVIVQ